MEKLYILDVSSYIFRAYHALPPMTNVRAEPTHALYGFIRSVLKLFKDFDPTHIVAVFDGPDNKKQRKEIYEKYKANRVRIHDDLPQQFEWAKQFCDLIGIPHIEVGGVEADDTMGSIAVWAAEEGAEIYLCTSDKDLCQIVQPKIYILNTWKDNLVIDEKMVQELHGVTPQQIADYLAIVGDSSDNIPGISGFGPKTAASLLQEFGTLENLLAHTEEIKGKKQDTLRREAEIALLSKRLATIHLNIAFTKDRSFFAKQPPNVADLKDFYLEMSFNSLVRELDSLLKIEEKTAYHLVDSLPSLMELIQKLNEEKEIAFDLVATDKHPLLARVVGFSFCVAEGVAFYIPLNGNIGKTTVLNEIRLLFENPNISFYSHNSKFDLHLLTNENLTLVSLSFDTILASYLLNSSSRKHTLDHLILHYFGKVKTLPKELVGSGKKEISMKQAPIEKVAQFSCQEADYTFRIKQILEPQIKKRKLESLLFDLELPLTWVLMKIERTGMYLDCEMIKAFAKEVGFQLKMTEAQIHLLAGEVFNISSPKQLAAILFDKLGIKPLKKNITGHSTSADVLGMLAGEHPIADQILSFRSLEKLRSTYLETLPLEVNSQTQRIHPTFNQFIAATGRLACQDPNLQNIPVRTLQGRRIREAFSPQQQGWKYLAADYSQIELRLLAHLSEDPQLLKAFREGDDIHAYTASLVFGIPLHDVNSIQRHQAKAINFGIIYGQQAYGLSQELKIDPKEALEFIEAYFIRYPKVLEFINICIENARKSGKATTMIGREREIPEIHSTNAIVRNAAERLAINTPLQGSSADLIKLAMLKIDTLLSQKKMKSKMILQIHDELIFEAPPEELDELEILVKEAMENAFSLKIPLLVEVKIGKNWAEC